MPIVTETLQLATIKEIDPRIEGVFQYHVDRARHDCLNRPADKTVRKVLLEFTFQPIMDQESRECDAVEMTVKARSKVPDHQSATYRLGVDAKRKGIFFNVDNPQNIDQRSLFEGGDPAEQ
jgi:hypothetical protein